MALLIAINLVSIFGFATFGLHPQLLAQFPWAPPIFAYSYPLFAQLQIALGFAIMVRECQKAMGFSWIKLFLAAAIISFTMEYLGTTYGVPFGKYAYTSLLGWKIAGQVPVWIPLSWFFMSLPSHIIADQLLGKWSGRYARIALGSFLLLTWDFTLDPAMSHLTPFWIWETSGVFFLQMPVKNLLGWFLTGCLILSVYEVLGLRATARWNQNQFPLKFYAVNLLLPFGLSIAGELWLSILASMVVYAACIGLANVTGGVRNFRAAR